MPGITFLSRNVANRVIANLIESRNLNIANSSFQSTSILYWYLHLVHGFPQNMSKFTLNWTCLLPKYVAGPPGCHSNQTSRHSLSLFTKFMGTLYPRSMGNWDNAFHRHGGSVFLKAKTLKCLKSDASHLLSRSWRL